MNSNISDNTKAILLLTAPLLVGSRVSNKTRPLTTSDYNKLARRLLESGKEPADLLVTGGIGLFSDWELDFDIEIINSLLERGFLLSQAIEHWAARGIWVVSRADAEYPQRLKERLGANTPPVLYGCGNRELLENGGLAVVGSRHTNEELIEYAQNIGALSAASGITIISGAAIGVDQAAMHGALRKQGTSVGVLASDLAREAVNREQREMLMEDQLVLVSPFDPRGGFNVGNAMQRNKLIYALADAGLVIDSSNGKGGTWTGAIEQLNKLHLVKIYIRSQGEISPGLQALRKKGAHPWPNPETPEEFQLVMAGSKLPDKTESTQQTPLTLSNEEDIVSCEVNNANGVLALSSPVDNDGNATISPADLLLATVEKLLEDIGPEVKDSEVAEYFNIEKKQATAWLKRLVENGKYTKRGRSAVYVRSNRFIS